MSTVSCHLHTVVIMAIIILIVAFTEELFRYIPNLTKLYTNSTNFILLITLVILVLLIDLPCGIVFTFLVLYLAVYVKRIINKFTNIPLDKYQSDSEKAIIHQNVSSNNNILEQTTIDTETKQMPLNMIATNQNDALSTVYEPSRDGYDVTGCRYDFKNSLQNMTKYGAPLSSCSVYNAEQTKQCGTVFYPLHG